MEGNLGYIFYHSLYMVKNDKLVINAIEKKKLTDRKISENDTKLFISNKKENDIPLYTTYPGFITGTGITHGIKDEDDDFSIGCYFDHTAGIPVLAGSSVKGALRSVFPIIHFDKEKNSFSYSTKNGGGIDTNKVKAKWIYALLEELKKENLEITSFLKTHTNPIEITAEKEQEILEYIYKLTMEIFEGVCYKTEKPNKKFLSIYQRDIFNDAFPTESYHTDKRFMDTDYITPHIKEGKTYEESMLLNPVPIQFLKVLPNVAFQFNFDLKDSAVYPALTADKKLLLFKKILLTIGAGAKTNVGYGQFSLDKLVTNEDEYHNKSDNENKQKRSSANKNFSLNKEQFKKNQESVRWKLTSLDGEIATFVSEKGSWFTKNIDTINKKFKEKADKKKKTFKELTINYSYNITINDDIDFATPIANFTVQPELI